MALLKRKLRMGMVGGGEGAFIGAVHRMAAAIDGEIELVCGAFSSNPARAKRSAENLYVDPERSYVDFNDMMISEAALPADKRMDFVSVVTPNDLHFAVVKSAIHHGFHVMCEKPATLNLMEALELRDMLSEANLVFGLAHTYTGYPMVKEARERVASGELGAIRKIIVEYPQGWLAGGQQASGENAVWRLNPERSGISCCMGDIGIHAANLAEFICGSAITETCADIAAVVEGRNLDDDGTVLLRFDNGARGVLIASQVCAGEENPLKIRIYGERGGLEWAQQEPNTLWLKWLDRPVQMLRTGGPLVGMAANENTRTPAGHPEGYLEAFANLYRCFSAQIRNRNRGENLSPLASDLPGINEAVRGMAFIEHVVNTSSNTEKWQRLPSY